MSPAETPTLRPVRPVVLVILDGWGLSDEAHGNAVHLARTPNFDRIWATRPRARLAASGEDVGLPPGQVGNSEVGHTNIGAGRVVRMDLPKIDAAIADGSFATNPALTQFAARLVVTGGTAHVMGLFSAGGVHSHLRHMAAAARELARQGVPVALHLFLDGRDAPPRSAHACLDQFRAALGGDMPGVTVATVCGRFYPLDRDHHWNRVKAAFDVIVGGVGHRAATAAAAIDAAYARGETDEFVLPTAIGAYGGARDGDGLMLVNFRADRAREILGALVDPAFDGFDAGARPRFAARLGMVEYSARLNGLMAAMFPAGEIANTLGQWVARHGRRQFRVAETEKYAHVTFFLNGGIEPPDPGEDRWVAPSPRVRTYDLAPQMAAAEVTARLCAAIAEGTDLIVCNYANPDMVGHTGNLAAAIAACEAVDQGLGAALAAVAQAGGAMLVTADHGNAEQMIDPVTGEPHTAHTTNPVPLVLIDPAGRGLTDGRLADIAPTLLALMGLAPPPEMTGRSLLTPAGA